MIRAGWRHGLPESKAGKQPQRAQPHLKCLRGFPLAMRVVRLLDPLKMGYGLGLGSGGKSCSLAVGGLPVRSHPGRVEVSLSKTPKPQLLLTSMLVPCMAANRREWVNERHKLYSALDKGAI